MIRLVGLLAVHISVIYWKERTHVIIFELDRVSFISMQNSDMFEKWNKTQVLFRLSYYISKWLICILCTSRFVDNLIMGCESGLLLWQFSSNSSTIGSSFTSCCRLRWRLSTFLTVLGFSPSSWRTTFSILSNWCRLWDRSSTGSSSPSLSLVSFPGHLLSLRRRSRSVILSLHWYCSFKTCH